MKIYNRILSIFLILSFYSFNTRAASLSLEEVMALGLNVLVIETENSEEPTCDYVSAPEGSMGKGITNATKVPGSLKIFSPDGRILYESGEYEKGESGMTVKIRGNTSAYSTKKPYKIKLQKKADLLLRGEKKYNDKNWVLLNDPALKIPMGFELSRLLELDWVPAGMHVNLVLNGNYKGFYYLVESVERNQSARIDVSEEGYIVEHDPYWWNENGEYLLSSYSPLYNYTFKYPDYADLSDEKINLIHEELKTLEEAVKNGSYLDYLDIESFAKWFLGHDLLGSWDGGGANFYLYKYEIPSGSPIKCGPIWDFDTIMQTEDRWSGPHRESRFSPFFQSNDTPFMKVYIDLWKNMGKEIQEGLNEFIQKINDYDYWEPVVKSAKATSSFWGPEMDLLELSEKYEIWFDARFEWIGEQLKDALDDAGVDSIHGTPVLSDVYNLHGVKILSKATQEEIRNLSKGIYIVNHKKVVIK